ncbi:phospholipase effector Tle1 domain-containing protein [Cupriavidus neocaledonicus]|uniref:Conserved hypothethical protein, aromatic compound dioxygenase domain n=1 Tax=Cupriavidus neocaledonicus TaxID=1040979 RepID=A0A375HRK0_9BURK
MKVGNATLDLRFLGIFDTVASVGVADSMPIAKGLMDWADGTMDIENVGKVVHYVAAHEIRQSFPLSTARIGAKAYPSNTKEFIYPGAHSDLGGGYGPGDQGKSVSGRSALLSQIALNDMYFEARNAGVKLLPKDKMLPEARVDFDIAPELDNAFNAYCDWTRFVEKESVSAGNGPPCENRMQYHMQLYWRWRAQVSPDSKFKGLSSYRNSSAQDKTDLWESELDWRKDVARAQEASKPRRVFNPRIGYVDLPPPADAVQRQIVAEVNAASRVPAAVSEFFDKFVHDSHGGFWLLGPITKDDRAVFIAEVRKKKAMYDKLMESAEKSGNPGYANNMRRRALAYELNAFERRVLEENKKTPGGVPLMTDADAADLRAIAGMSTEAVLAVMGTATRREPKGHGRYRRVFDS